MSSDVRPDDTLLHATFSENAVDVVVPGKQGRHIRLCHGVVPRGVDGGKYVNSRVLLEYRVKALRLGCVDGIALNAPHYHDIAMAMKFRHKSLSHYGSEICVCRLDGVHER